MEKILIVGQVYSNTPFFLPGRTIFLKFTGYSDNDNILHFVDFFTKETSQGRVAGFVSSKEKRNKGRGDYYVIKLNPAKTFWTKNVNAAEKISESDLISADVNNGGEAKNIWRKKQ